MSGPIPHLTVSDAQAAVDFYTRAFGAEETFRYPSDDGKRLLHVHMHLNGGDLMLADDFPEYRGGKSNGPPAGVTLHLGVDDADAAWNKAIAAGAEPVMPLADMFWGDRYGQVKDPFGHTWSIGAPIKP